MAATNVAAADAAPEGSVDPPPAGAFGDVPAVGVGTQVEDAVTSASVAETALGSLAFPLQELAQALSD